MGGRVGIVPPASTGPRARRGARESGGSQGSGDSALRAENERLEDEVRRLEDESDRSRSDLAEARAEAERAEATAAEARAASEQEEPAPSDSGGELAVVGPDNVEGEPLPEVMPEDFPLPSGASVRDVYEDEYSFSMTILLDSEFEQTVGFFEEQPSARDFEELVGDRIEGQTEGFEGVETSWERGTFIPEDLPRESDYEQSKENLDLSVYELDPSGVQVDVRWSAYEMLDRQNEAEEGEQDSRTS